jgi:hypothetical protein
MRNQFYDNYSYRIQLEDDKYYYDNTDDEYFIYATILSYFGQYISYGSIMPIFFNKIYGRYIAFSMT